MTAAWDYDVPDNFLRLEGFRRDGIRPNKDELAYLDRTHKSLIREYGQEDFYAVGWRERLLTLGNRQRPRARSRVCGIIHSYCLLDSDRFGWVEDSAVIEGMGRRYGAKSLALDREALEEAGWLDIWDLRPTSARYTLTFPTEVSLSFDNVLPGEAIGYGRFVR